MTRHDNIRKQLCSQYTNVCILIYYPTRDRRTHLAEIEHCVLFAAVLSDDGRQVADETLLIRTVLINGMLKQQLGGFHILEK